jgi:hypothetical protein
MNGRGQYPRFKFTTMKKSEKPTPYIYIRAYTQSEWDSCDFAILKINAEWLALLRERLELLEPFQGRSDFYSHEYWDSPFDYYITPDDQEDEFLEETAGDWCFITITPEGLKRLEKPQAPLSTHQLVITSDGYGHFTAIGKHTDEGYHTAEFKITELLNHFNA